MVSLLVPTDRRVRGAGVPKEDESQKSGPLHLYFLYASHHFRGKTLGKIRYTCAKYTVGTVYRTYGTIPYLYRYSIYSSRHCGAAFTRWASVACAWPSCCLATTWAWNTRSTTSRRRTGRGFHFPASGTGTALAACLLSSASSVVPCFSPDIVVFLVYFLFQGYISSSVFHKSKYR
jgi:hypothetical protein